MSSAQHNRKASSRATLARRATKGPLDAVEDPLSVSGSVSPSLASSSNSPLPVPPSSEPSLSSRAPASEQQPSTSQTADPPPASESGVEERDLSFLLDAAIYHPLSQLDVPGAFRKPFLPPPNGDTPLAQSFAQLDGLLSQCDFLRAAHYAGSILTSGTVPPSDAESVFRLLDVRYACLELSGNLPLAAQEAKSLEDLSSAFYYNDFNPDPAGPEDQAEPRKVPQHIMPFSLRLQALRLQSIGFSDPRRGVSTLYDTGLECREHITSPSTPAAQRKVWSERLQEISMRVVNALIEMGDLDCAIRTLATMKPTRATATATATWLSRMVLLTIRVGDLVKARRLIKSSELTSSDKTALESLLAIAEGRFDDAADALATSQGSVEPSIQGLVRQNLAVAYLYDGKIQQAREVLEALVDQGHSFQSLTVNLATIYDLCSDRSRDLKTAMISQIASRQTDDLATRSFVNADFKL